MTVKHQVKAPTPERLPSSRDGGAARERGDGRYDEVEVTLHSGHLAAELLGNRGETKHKADEVLLELILADELANVLDGPLEMAHLGSQGVKGQLSVACRGRPVGLDLFLLIVMTRSINGRRPHHFQMFFFPSFPTKARQGK